MREGHNSPCTGGSGVSDQGGGARGATPERCSLQRQPEPMTAKWRQSSGSAWTCLQNGDSSDSRRGVWGGQQSSSNKGARKPHQRQQAEYVFGCGRSRGWIRDGDGAAAGKVLLRKTGYSILWVGILRFLWGRTKQQQKNRRTALGVCGSERRTVAIKMTAGAKRWAAEGFVVAAAAAAAEAAGGDENCSKNSVRRQKAHVNVSMAQGSSRRQQQLRRTHP